MAMDGTKLNKDAERFYKNLSALPEAEKLFMMLFAIRLELRMTETQAFVQFAREFQHVKIGAESDALLNAARPELNKV